ncbi:MAG: BrnT family toxin [Geminicoccaceae bacterium]
MASPVVMVGNRPRMRYEWDHAKSEANARERGLDFALAVRLFEGPTLEARDPRQWGEIRVKAIGVIEGRELVVVYTDRGDMRRIISFRDAARAERQLYWREIRAGWSDGAD